jgi:hypothetical protein
VSIEADKSYQMKILAVGLADNTAGDKQCIEMELGCPDGKMWHRIWLTPATSARVRKTLAEFGIDASAPEFWDGNCALLMGMDAHVETELNEYNGKTSVRVKWFNGPKRARESAPLTPEKVASIAALFASPSDSDDSVPW